MRPAILDDAPAAPATYAHVPPDTGASAAVRCANCGAEGCEHYCPRCGQETHDLHRSIAGILGELLDAFAGWDGKIPTTLWTMVRHPGALTTEFFAGRRARYLRPLRLYLTMSVVFFLSLNALPSPPTANGTAGEPEIQIGAVVSKPGLHRTTVTSTPGVVKNDSAFDAFLARHRNEKGRGPIAWFKRHFVAGLLKLKSLPPQEQMRMMKDAFFEKAPDMMFLLLPVFALLLRALYLRASVYYAEHFVFALHNHAFAYFALTLAHLASVWLRPLGIAGATRLAIFLWTAVYFFVSMRRVFGGSRRRTAVKYVVLSMAYGTLLMIAVGVTALVTLVTLA